MTSQEVRKLWAEALRSGNYKQGVGRLQKIYNNDSYYCCLGVLCDLYCQYVEDVKGINSYGGITFNNEGFGLSSKLRDWVGIGEKVHNNLIDLNDNQRADFSDIANYIDNLEIPNE